MDPIVKVGFKDCPNCTTPKELRNCGKCEDCIATLKSCKPTGYIGSPEYFQKRKKRLLQFHNRTSERK